MVKGENPCVERNILYLFLIPFKKKRAARKIFYHLINEAFASNTNLQCVYHAIHTFNSDHLAGNA